MWMFVLLFLLVFLSQTPPAALCCDIQPLVVSLWSGLWNLVPSVPGGGFGPDLQAAASHRDDGSSCCSRSCRVWEEVCVLVDAGEQSCSLTISPAGETRRHKACRTNREFERANATRAESSRKPKLCRGRRERKKRSDVNCKLNDQRLNDRLPACNRAAVWDHIDPEHRTSFTCLCQNDFCR